MKFKVFTRTWWKNNPQWPNGLEPSLGRKYVLRYVETEDKALEMCQAWNATHKPGRLSKKAEYEQV